MLFGNLMIFTFGHSDSGAITTTGTAVLRLHDIDVLQCDCSLTKQPSVDGGSGNGSDLSRTHCDPLEGGTGSPRANLHGPGHLPEYGGRTDTTDKDDTSVCRLRVSTATVDELESLGIKQ